MCWRLCTCLYWTCSIEALITRLNTTLRHNYAQYRVLKSVEASPFMWYVAGSRLGWMAGLPETINTSALEHLLLLRTTRHFCLLVVVWGSVQFECRVKTKFRAALNQPPTSFSHCHHLPWSHSLQKRYDMYIVKINGLEDISVLGQKPSFFHQNFS